MLTWRVYLGSALDVLRELPDQSVNCVVTSPPYWGLRNYGHGDQIGMEGSPGDYVCALVTVFAEARRVLRDDGAAWCNLGDSYNSNSDLTRNDTKAAAGLRVLPRQQRQIISELKPKDLIGIPWRTALALQADGWYLRSDVIWAKPNPMPESVTDRPTKAHEYVFLLTKRERYTYNADAIREPVTQAMLDQIRQGYDGEGTKDYEGAGVQNPSSVKARIIARKRDKQSGHGNRRYAGFNERWDSKERELADKASQTPRNDGERWNENDGRGFITANGANARTVWTIPTEPSPYEHFAVMPRALARKCILAGCPYGGVVLDPFAGTGTSGVVALEEGRNFVGIELNPKYHAIARERLGNVAPLLASEVA